MGITIHYRGTIDDIAMVESWEDRVVDLVLALGGKATMWRSYADHDPSRMVRGVMLEMTPGQETTSLLISPEGHLINLFEIEAAEKMPLEEPPWCFVKTQFGSLQGHIAVVHLLDAIKSHYISNLEVEDESGYWQHRDPAVLAGKMKQLGDAISALGQGLEQYGLSDEAAEDPEILAARIERVAALVATTISGRRDSGGDRQPLDEGEAIPCLPSPSGDTAEDLVPNRKLAIEMAEALLRELMAVVEDSDPPGSLSMVATQGLLDVLGGLVQATGDELDGNQARALAIVQLKRALKGHAFARGAIFALRANGVIDETRAHRIHTQLDSILESIQGLLADAWTQDA